jgi:nitrite reductase (NADH) small subunit
VSWLDVGPLDGLPQRGARVVRVGGVDIAVFRTGEGRVFALRDQCPHRGGPLSQGIVHGDRVTCPLHEWVIDLRSGNAVGADTGCTPAFATRVADGRVAIDVPDGFGQPLSAKPEAVSSTCDAALDAAFDPRVSALFEGA